MSRAIMLIVLVFVAYSGLAPEKYHCLFTVQ